MPLSTLVQTGLSVLLDNPVVVEMTAQAGVKALSIVKGHFTFTADEMSKAYQEGYGYALVAISIGLAAPDKKLTFAQKLIHPKVTREFAEQIERDYLQLFAKQRGIPSEELPQLRKQFIDELKRFIKHKNKLFQIEAITEQDLAALISYQGTIAITDLVLEQMQHIAPVNDTLAAFLRYNDLLGKAILFFFRELVRKDERLENTQAALQREGLCIEVRNLQTALKTAEDNLTKAIQDNSANTAQLAQQLDNLRQAQANWQTRTEQFTHFTRQFSAWTKLLNSQVEHVLAAMEQVQEKLGVVHDDIKEILSIQKKLMAHLGLSLQVKPHDEFTQHNSTSRQLIREAIAIWKRFTPKNTQYSRVSIMVGSALSSTGQLDKAEQLFLKALKITQHQDEKALAYFNLFQVRLRRKAYAQALADLQQAITLEPQRYALHDIHKYPPERLLGAGGMGCVFLCQNRNRLIQGKRVVVKCFWETLKGTIEEVFKEPFRMHEIAGKYVPKPLDFGYTDLKQKKAFFVTEYIEGAIDGGVWLETNGPMDLETGLQVGLQIAKGLQVAHDAGIYHLDLKPANVLLKRTNSGIAVKIIDFGLSQVAPSLRTEALTRQSQSNLSTYGQAIIGTLDYAPPEQQGETQHGKPSARSDVFAFGATMYHLWTGNSPRYFRERELPDNAALRDLLFDCVKPEPTGRPDSASQLVNHFQAIQTDIAKRKAEEEQTKEEFIKAAQERLAKEQEKQRRQAEMARQQAEEEQRQQAEMARQQAEEEQIRRQVEMAQQQAEKEQSRREEERKRLEDQNAWQRACQQNTKYAYQAYLNGHTLKQYAAEAKQRLQAIEQKELAAEQRRQEIVEAQAREQYIKEAQERLAREQEQARQKAIEQKELAAEQRRQEIAEAQAREQYIKEAQERLAREQEQARLEEQKRQREIARQSAGEEQNKQANRAQWVINALAFIMRCALIIFGNFFLWNFDLRVEQFVVLFVLIYLLYHSHALFYSLTGMAILKGYYLWFLKTLAAILSGLGIAAGIFILLYFSIDGIYDDEESWEIIALLSFSAIGVMLADHRERKNILDTIIFYGGLILFLGWIYGMGIFFLNYQARP